VTGDLAKKLGIRPGLSVCVLQAPADAVTAIRQACPKGVRWRRALGAARFDLIFFWPKARDGLAAEFARLQSHLQPDGAIWTVIPKKAFAAKRGVRLTWEEMQAEGLRASSARIQREAVERQGGSHRGKRSAGRQCFPRNRCARHVVGRVDHSFIIAASA